jgi:hypothetical protein
VVFVEKADPLLSTRHQGITFFVSNATKKRLNGVA